MKTPQQWLSEVKASPEKMEHWLQRQYIGEVLAHERILSLATATSDHKKIHKVLSKIATDEHQHAQWVLGLLVSRNIEVPTPTIEGTRYWDPIFDNIESFEDIAAAGHHAEHMRLERIKLLAADADIPDDIRDVFSRILPDEQYHDIAFEKMSNPEAIERMRPFHEAGLKLLGLSL